MSLTNTLIRTVTRLGLGAGSLVFVLWLLFAASPLFASNDYQLCALVSGQEWMVQQISRDAWMLANGTASQREQGISELQTTLPRWENNQAQLKQALLPVAIQPLFGASMGDYAAIDAAAHALLAPSSLTTSTSMMEMTTTVGPGNVEAAILIDHEPGYFFNVAQMDTVLQQQLLNDRSWLFDIEVLLGTLLFCGGIGYWMMIERWFRWHGDTDDQRATSASEGSR